MTHRERSLTPWITNDPESYRKVFAASLREQFDKALHLEIAFRRYAESIGCTCSGVEIMATERQAGMLRAWLEEQRL